MPRYFPKLLYIFESIIFKFFQKFGKIPRHTSAPTSKHAQNFPNSIRITTFYMSFYPPPLSSRHLHAHSPRTEKYFSGDSKSIRNETIKSLTKKLSPYPPSAYTINLVVSIFFFSFFFSYFFLLWTFYRGLWTF